MSRGKAIWTAELSWPIWGHGAPNGKGKTLYVDLDRDGRQIHVWVTLEQLVIMGKSAQRALDEKAGQ